jgi:hypothetical protein
LLEVSPEPAEAADAKSVAPMRGGVSVDVALDRVIAGDADPLGFQLLSAARIAPHAELGHADGIALNLEPVSRQVVLGVAAHVAWVAEAGGLLILVIPGVRVRIVLDDAPATLRIVHLGSDVIRD